MQKILVFMGLGLEIGFMIFFASLVEKWLGPKYQTNGLIFLGLTFIFLIAWFIQIIYLLKRLQPKESSLGDSDSSSSPKL